MSIWTKYGRKISKWFKKRAKKKVEDMMWELGEGVLEEVLTALQDEMSKWLEEKHSIPASVSSEGFWIIVDKLDDKLPVELDDQTPGK